MRLQLSAQESRRKRKEYMDTLEQRVQGYYNENNALRQKLKQLEQSNRALAAQLKKFQGSNATNGLSVNTPSSTPATPIGVGQNVSAVSLSIVLSVSVRH